MKRILSVLMVFTVFCSLLAGCGGQQDAGETNPSASVQGPESALAALKSVWDLYDEEEKFWVVGGSTETAVENEPGAVELTDTDYLTASLLIPQAQLSGVTEAASMIHSMNANTFTCGVYKVSDVNGFAAAMEDVWDNHQWICGIPELLKIVDLGGGYVLVAFGVGDAMTPFSRHLSTAHPQAKTLVEKNMA